MDEHSGLGVYEVLVNGPDQTRPDQTRPDQTGCIRNWRFSQQLLERGIWAPQSENSRLLFCLPALGIRLELH
ncbi:hypothetical protein M0802_010469 [Mischocyttarus mexicanus]|nr:hypothetical protein M0802_010469 [Mischocyttarus mexicanus]